MQASEVFKIPIPTDIDPNGDYTVRTDFRPAQSPPTATPTTSVDVPEPVALLIVLGDIKIHHERSLEEPPAPFLEGEDVDEAESDEDHAGGSTPKPPRKLARMLTAWNLSTLGVADKGFTFGSVVESMCLQAQQSNECLVWSSYKLKRYPSAGICDGKIMV